MPDRVHLAAMHNYDFLYSLSTGDVTSNAICVEIHRGADIGAAISDERFDLVELSLSGYIQSTLKGDNTFVGIPVFLRRMPCQRSWYVHQDSDIDSFADLWGRRIGLNHWSATGNVWARIAAQDDGLDLRSVHWFLGSTDGGPWNPQSPGSDYAQFTTISGRMIDRLIAGELDAVTSQLAPTNYYADHDHPPVRRLIEDFRAAEYAYISRTQVYPAHHVLAVRRTALEQSPHLAVAAYRLLVEARAWWQLQRLKYGDTTPWITAEIEFAMEEFGDWQLDPYGTNPTMLSMLCKELHAQRITDTLADPVELFTEFSQMDQSQAGVVSVPTMPWHSWH